jgi:predicted DNA-binding protein YlxM (UPF0122 family)
MAKGGPKPSQSPVVHLVSPLSMPDRPKAYNLDARTERLVADWHAYNHRIQSDLSHSQQMARQKTETLLQLRKDYSAQQIAELLGITRQAVYDSLREAGEVDSEVEDQLHLDEQVRSALSAFHHALQVAQETVRPFAVDGQLATPAPREAMALAMDLLHEAEDDYDAALERAGRLPPFRGRPRRFLIQHLDMGEATNGANWTAYRQTLEGAKSTADAVFDPANLAVRQEIQDSKTGQWWFRGAGSSEWSGPTRQRMADFDMDGMLATGESGRRHPEQERN